MLRLAPGHAITHALHQQLAKNRRQSDARWRKIFRPSSRKKKPDLLLQKQQDFISKSSFNTNSCHDYGEFLHFRLFLVSLRQMEFAFHMMS